MKWKMSEDNTKWCHYVALVMAFRNTIKGKEPEDFTADELSDLRTLMSKAHELYVELSDKGMKLIPLFPATK